MEREEIEGEEEEEDKRIGWRKKRSKDRRNWRDGEEGRDEMVEIGTEVEVE